MVDRRDKALLAVYRTTGLRFKEVLEMTRAGLDRLTGEFTVVAKGGKVRPVKMSADALKLVRRYLAVRPEVTTDRLWLTNEGEAITYWGLFSIFRRLKVRSGVPRLRAHLFRHGFARTALQNHAERAAVMDMLGHTTDKMARRYAGSVRQETAAKMMPQFAPEV